MINSKKAIECDMRAFSVWGCNGMGWGSKWRDNVLQAVKMGFWVV